MRFGWNFDSVELHQYSETNLMHFLFSLLKIQCLLCFKHYLPILRRSYTNGTSYTVCMLCQLAAAGLECSTPILLQPTDITCTRYTKCNLCSTSWGWSSNVWNMQRHLILNKLNKKCITLVSLYWCTVMHDQRNIKKKLSIWYQPL
jgi:hypothetical protein